MTVRVRSAPAYDPPYDDELPTQWWGAGALQPLLELPAASPEPFSDRPALRAPAPTGAAPATIAAATRFVQACLEILNGYRPLTHVRVLADPLEAPAVLAEMTRAVRRFRPASGREALVKLRTMRTCEPRPGVAEIAVVVGAEPPTRERPAQRAPSQAVWALAYRLEQRHARWLCTAATLL
jgi:uncharacterized protein DUF6459